MINFVVQIAKDGLLAKRELNTPSALLLFSILFCSEMAEVFSGIYKIQSKVKPERFYIGSSVDIMARWASHVCTLKKGKHENGRLRNHSAKYGWDDLEFSVIERCPENILIEREQYYLDLLTPFFNIRVIADSNLHIKFTEEHCRNISKAKKGKPSTFKGKHQSQESKDKQSAKMKGRKQSPETVEKRVSKFRGRKQSREVVERRAALQRGRKNPTGKPAWNTGLTKETNSIMKQISETLKKRNAEKRKNKS